MLRESGVQLQQTDIVTVNLLVDLIALYVRTIIYRLPFDSLFFCVR